MDVWLSIAAIATWLWREIVIGDHLVLGRTPIMLAVNPADIIPIDILVCDMPLMHSTQI